MDQHMNFIADLANCLDNVMQRPKKAGAADRQAQWVQLVQWAQLSTLHRLQVNIASGQSVGHTGRASICTRAWKHRNLHTNQHYIEIAHDLSRAVTSNAHHLVVSFLI